MAQTDAKRGYGKGYAAGRKRTEAETKATIDAANRQWELLRSKRLEIATAVMSGLVATNTWAIDGKTVTDMTGRARLARIAADALLKEFGQ